MYEVDIYRVITLSFDPNCSTCFNDDLRVAFALAMLTSSFNLALLSWLRLTPISWQEGSTPHTLMCVTTQVCVSVWVCTFASIYLCSFGQSVARTMSLFPMVFWFTFFLCFLTFFFFLSLSQLLLAVCGVFFFSFSLLG